MLIWSWINVTGHKFGKSFVAVWAPL